MEPLLVKTAFFAVWVPSVALLLMPSSASAHHATAVQYDVTKTVTLKGRITRVNWANPHIHVDMEIKTGDSGQETWTVEFPSPGAVIVAGLSKQLLTPRTVLTFEAYASKSGFRPNPRNNSSAEKLYDAKLQRFACVKAVTLSDGSHVGFVVGI